MKIAHYSVFAAAPGGGKQFAIVEGVNNPVDMQRIASQTGQPLTGFILNAGAELVEVRFFSPTKEKGASDSGALVIGEHLRQLGRGGDKLTVQMGDEGLEVHYYDGLWWSEQEDTTIKSVEVPKAELMNALGLWPDWVDEDQILCSGSSKINIIVPIFAQIESCQILNNLQPKFDELASINRTTNTNGVIVFCGLQPSTQHNAEDVELRFFAPSKGLIEDNAGSYTVASLCGYLAEAWEYSDDFIAWQGKSMGKPSKLYVEFARANGVAQNIQVGGKVKRLEVSHA